jgi:GGDEF domain-containing protein
MHPPLAHPERFLNYEEHSLQQIRALGLTQTQIDALRPHGLLATDNVTGFHEGRCGPGRTDTLLRAIRHAARTASECYYVEMDVRNLGGLNAVLGHTGANEVYRAIAAVIRSRLSPVAAAAVFFRHGGDEVSALLIGSTEAAITDAFDEVRQQVDEVARRHGVDDVPHPKHPQDRRSCGTGVRFGLVRLTAGHEGQPAHVFALADEDVKRRERAAPSEVA